MLAKKTFKMTKQVGLQGSEGDAVFYSFVPPQGLGSNVVVVVALGNWKNSEFHEKVFFGCSPLISVEILSLIFGS